MFLAVTYKSGVCNSDMKDSIVSRKGEPQRTSKENEGESSVSKLIFSMPGLLKVGGWLGC